ncbi:MAG: hypothetical protein DRO12_05405, partial [Thermoprotei archaeon]
GSEEGEEHGTPEEGAEERLRRLEQEVGELKESIPKTIDELRETVNSLRNTVVEIRSAVSELENPFNLLRVVTSEEDIARLIEARKKLAAERRAPGGKAEEERVEEKPEAEEAERVEIKAEAKPPSMPAGFETAVSIIKWVWTLLDAGLDRDDVVDITKFCEFLGFLPQRSSEYVTYLTNTMTKARLGGLNLDEFLLIIYSAAKASGVNIQMRELEETAFKLLRRILKRIPYEEK